MASATGDAITVATNSAKLSDRSRLKVCECGVQPRHYEIDHAEVTNPELRTF